jgi:secreted trypsin-like serine protease
MRSRFAGIALLGLALCSCSEAESPPEADGTTRSAIIAGTVSTSDQDAVVLLYRANRDQTCTGTMVAPNLVVTARHCVSDTNTNAQVVDAEPSDIRVYVGRTALVSLARNADHPATVGRELFVASSRSLYPDIAFVVLEASLKTPLANIRLDSPGVQVGESLRVIGYGIDETGTRPVWRMQRSDLVVYAVGPGRSRVGEPLAAGELVFGEAACSGDSGGPAFSTATGELVAIASRVGNGTTPNADDPAAFCTGDKADDVYTDFSPVRDLVARAFAAAEGHPLASTEAPASNDATTNDAKSDGGGCALASKRTPGGAIAFVMLSGALVVFTARRRRRSTRARLVRGQR